MLVYVHHVHACVCVMIVHCSVIHLMLVDLHLNRFHCMHSQYMVDFVCVCNDSSMMNILILKFLLAEGDGGVAPDAEAGAT